MENLRSGPGGGRLCQWNDDDDDLAGCSAELRRTESQ